MKKRHDLIDIACRVRRETKKGVAVADGTMETVEIDDGRIVEREKWFWLPKSQVEINNDNTVTMPEWLAIDVGLI